MNIFNRFMRFDRLVIQLSTVLTLIFSPASQAVTSLADQPLFAAGVNQPGNVALALSVEFPTAVSSSYLNIAYTPSSTYLGYFDAEKCYQYHTETDVNYHYFEPIGSANSHVCSGYWSGNFLNWALMQAIDSFRYGLTGGYRSIDQVGITVLEKAWASGQGGSSYTTHPTLTDSTIIQGATPYNISSFKTEIVSYGNKFRFTSIAANFNSPLADTTVPAGPSMTTTIKSNVYEMYARVKVCVPNMLESNCVIHGSNYKPEGLMQANADKLNFAEVSCSPKTGSDADNSSIILFRTFISL